MWWLAAAAVHAQSLSWDTLVDEALVAWAVGPGAGASRRIEGARAASRAARLPVGFRWEQQTGLRSQDQVIAAVELPLGIGLADSAAWRREEERRQSAHDADRLAFVDAVVVAFHERWVAGALLEHLDDYAAEVDAYVTAMAAASADGSLALLEIEDLRAESVHVLAERAATRRAVTETEARLQALVGPVTVAIGHHGHDDVWPQASPWEAVFPVVDRHPAIVAVDAAAETERARARAGLASRLPVVTAGPMWARDDAGRMVPFGLVGVDVPLRDPGAADRRVARSEAIALDADAEWVRRQVAAEVRREHLAWLSARAQLEALDTEVLGPLVARQERLEEAFAAGLVSVDRVVRARQQRHEAEHDLIDVIGALHASRVRSEAWRRLLEEPS